MPALSNFSRFALIFYSLMALLAFLGGFWRDHLEHWWHLETLAADTLLGAAIGVVLVGLSRLSMRWRQMRALAQDFHEVLKGLEWPDVVVCAAMSSLGEELLFRGLVQRELGIGWASVLFAVLHVGPSRRYLLWTAFALLAGWLFGSLFDWRGSLSAPLLAHFVVNLLNLRYLSRLPAWPDAKVGVSSPQTTTDDETTAGSGL